MNYQPQQFQLNVQKVPQAATPVATTVAAPAPASAPVAPPTSAPVSAPTPVQAIQPQSLVITSQPIPAVASFTVNSPPSATEGQGVPTSTNQVSDVSTPSVNPTQVSSTDPIVISSPQVQVDPVPANLPSANTNDIQVTTSASNTASAIADPIPAGLPNAINAPPQQQALIITSTPVAQASNVAAPIPSSTWVPIQPISQVTQSPTVQVQAPTVQVQVQSQSVQLAQPQVVLTSTPIVPWNLNFQWPDQILNYRRDPVSRGTSSWNSNQIPRGQTSSSSSSTSQV